MLLKMMLHKPFNRNGPDITQKQAEPRTKLSKAQSNKNRM